MADYLNIAGRVRTTASDGVAMEAQEVKDLLLDKSQQEVNADVQQGLSDRYTKEETYNRDEIETLVDPTNYVSVVATNLTTAVTDLLPAEGATDTIYRIGNWNGTQYDPTVYALYSWNGTAYVCLAVRSFVGEVYDISVNHPDGQGNPTPYSDLTAALGTDGANIPADIRRGGMSIKFIQGTAQSSDNNYIQYTLMAKTFTTDISKWYESNNEKTSIFLDFSSGFTENDFINADGSIVHPTGYIATDYIPLLGTPLIFQVCAQFRNSYGGGVAFYDEDFNFISSIYYTQTPESSTSNSVYNINASSIPQNAKYFRASAYNDSVLPYVKICYYNKDVVVFLGLLAKIVSINKDDIESIKNLLQFSVYDFIQADFTINDFINKNGGIEHIEGYYATDYISLFETPVSFQACALFKNSYGGGIAFYNENKEFIGNIYNTLTPVDYTDNDIYDVNISDIPQNAKYFRVSAYISEATLSPFIKIKYYNKNIAIFLSSLLSSINDLHYFNTYTVESDNFSLNDFINKNGGIEHTEGYIATDYISLLDSSPLSLQVCALFRNEWGGGIAFYNENKEFISSIYHILSPDSSIDNSVYDVNISDIPQNAKYFRVSAYNANNLPFVKITYYNKDVILMLSNLASILSDDTTKVNKLLQYNIYHLVDSDFTEPGFINANGSIAGTQGYYYTKYLPVSGIKACKVVACVRNKWGGGIAFYDKDYKFISSIYNVLSQNVSDGNNYSYTLNIADIPSGALFMCVQRGTVANGTVDYTTDKYSWYTDIMPVEPEPIEQKEFISNYAATFPSSDYVQCLLTPQTKNLYNIGCSMLVSTMGKIKITKGQTLAYRSGKIEIDDTNVYVYNPNDPSTILSTIPHGLTIADFLIVNIEVGDKPAPLGNYYYVASLTIMTNNASPFTTNIAWTGCSGNACVWRISGEYSEININFGGEAFKKDLWIFGDSYTDGWPYYAFSYNATNYMIDGKSGRASIEAFESLKNALKLGKPKMILWMMGMNDGDSANAVNTNWNTTFNNLKQLCEEYSIELLPATIPNTPSVTNYYKNAVVYASGLHYIDVAAILGATEINSSWFTGLLSADNVHPSGKGAAVIANYLISQLPMMKK